MHGIYETNIRDGCLSNRINFYGEVGRWDWTAPSLHLIVTSLLNVKEFGVLGGFGHCSFVRGRLFPTKRTRAHILPICKSRQENYVVPVELLIFGVNIQENKNFLVLDIVPLLLSSKHERTSFHASTTTAPITSFAPTPTDETISIEPKLERKDLTDANGTQYSPFPRIEFTGFQV